MWIELPILLAARLGQVCWIVLCPDNEFFCSPTMQSWRYVGMKGSETCGVLRYSFAIDPNSRLVIDSTKME